MSQQHTPVLLAQVLTGLAPRPGDRAIDGTIGAGGHAEAWLEQTSPDGRLLGLDTDAAALLVAAGCLARFGERATLVNANFAEMLGTATAAGFVPVQQVLLDLGLSSMQLNDPERGFSFDSTSLDMRADARGQVTAADLVNGLAERELADLIYRLGEEPRSRRIARAIVVGRPYGSALALSSTIAEAVPRRGRIHPATRTFQALRMAVNRELENLAAALGQIVSLLAVGGRVAIITFHSLEDRMVKRFLRDEPQLAVLTKHPVQPERSEVLTNPRARSAKLRIAERRT